jgi:hypothetical protein
MRNQIEPVGGRTRAFSTSNETTQRQASSTHRNQNNNKRFKDRRQIWKPYKENIQ